MKRGTNPSVSFETLTTIQNQYLGPEARLPKEEIIAIIFDVSSEEDRSIERRMRGEVQDLERAMCEEYRQLNRNHTKRMEGDQGEVLLSHFTGV